MLLAWQGNKENGEERMSAAIITIIYSRSFPDSDHPKTGENPSNA